VIKTIDRIFLYLILVTKNFRHYLENYSYRFILMNLENGIELMSYKQYRFLDDLSLGYFIFFL
jgi:hypothetical protein